MISREEYFSKRDPFAFPFWQKATIGIAGAGGLGSNIAISLARAGIGTLIIADYDIVTLENLNRQEDEEKRLAGSGTHYALSDDETCKR